MSISIINVKLCNSQIDFYVSSQIKKKSSNFYFGFKNFIIKFEKLQLSGIQLAE